MKDLNILNDFSVLLLEESQTLQALFDDWISGISTKVVSSPRDIPGQFDESVVVACLSQSALADQEEEVRKNILARNPYCQLVMILPRSTFQSIHEKDYDASIQRPVFKETFQEKIVNAFERGVYSALLREFYELNTKLLWVKRAGVPEDAPDDVDVKQLLERHGQLCSQLNTLRENLSTEDIEAISESIKLHKRYLTEPDSESDTGKATKYHPARCPACKLPWGVDHRNELGKGLISIGAGVWKCTRCREIVHGLGESGRRVMHG